jgi:hypothetical protein
MLLVNANQAVKIAVDGHIVEGKVVGIDTETSCVTVMQADGSRKVQVGKLDFIVDLHLCESVTVRVVDTVTAAEPLDAEAVQAVQEQLATVAEAVAAIPAGAE